MNFGIEFISKTIIFSALIASIIAIFGWILIQLKIESVLVLTYEYPIFIGEPGRSRALFETPNSLFIFLVFPILLLIHDLKNTKKFNFSFSYSLWWLCYIFKIKRFVDKFDFNLHYKSL